MCNCVCVEPNLMTIDNFILSLFFKLISLMSPSVWIINAAPTKCLDLSLQTIRYSVNKMESFVQ